MEFNIGERLKRLIDRSELNQDQLAEIVGVSQGTISNICTNQRTPTLKNLEKIATALSITLSEFFSVKSETNRPSPGKNKIDNKSGEDPNRHAGYDGDNDVNPVIAMLINDLKTAHKREVELLETEIGRLKSMVGEVSKKGSGSNRS